MKYVPDRTGRFPQRPHYGPDELDFECESIITSFLSQRYGSSKFPVLTDDLTRLLERDTEDLDLYADLSGYGESVEGLTEFQPGKKPRVEISADLANDERRENRLRTTLTHEYGHVHFHAYLWEIEQSGLLWGNTPTANKQICKRDDMLGPNQNDWMEWQAGHVCGALLMPASYVRRLVGAYTSANGIYGAVDQASIHARALIAEVQAAFQVSAEAATVRLRRLKFLGQTTATPSLFDR